MRLRSVFRCPFAAPAALSKAAAFLLLAACHAPSARAGDAIEAGSLAAHANFATIDLTLPYRGDDNGNATVMVRYRQTGAPLGTESFQGYPLTRVGMNHAFQGKLLWLDEGASYDVVATVSDSDGGGGEIAATIVTRSTPSPVVVGSPIWVGPAGDDSSSGTDPNRPKRTIQAAVDALSPRQNTVYVLPGVYRERVVLKREPPGDEYRNVIGIHGPDSTIVDGSASREHPKWLRRSKRFAGGAYWHARWESPLDSLAMVVAGRDQRLHRRLTLDQLLKPPPGFPRAGFYYDDAGRELYVRLERGTEDPNRTTMHIAERTEAIFVRSPNWIVSDLTIRFTNESGVRIGGYDGVEPGSGTVVTRCRFWNAQGGILGNRSSNDVLVDSCTFEDSRVSTWSWGASKRHLEEGSHGVRFFGSGWTVRRCTVRGTFDGIQAFGRKPPDGIDPADGNQSDVHDNTILDVADDGLEFEAIHGGNFAAWRNHVDRANHGISTSEMIAGPMYVLYNDFVNNDGAGIKLGGGSTGRCYYFHNTITSASHSHGVSATDANLGNVIFRNNVIVGVDGAETGWPLYNTYGDRGGCSFDYDLVYRARRGPDARLAIWRSGRSLDGVRAGLEWERHGLEAAPAYADSARGDFTPRPASAGVDAGAILPGINWLNCGTPRFLGRWPDMGAHEAPSVAPPADCADLRARAAPAPL